MKFLLVTLEYSPYHGGVAHYYGNLVKHARENIEVMTNKNGRLVNEKWLFLKWLPSLYWIARKIKMRQIDYVMVGHILPIGIAVWLLSFVINFKYCVFLHGYDLSMATVIPRKKKLTQLILNRADKIICANSRTASEARGLVLPVKLDKVVVVNPSIDTLPRIYDEEIVKYLKRQYGLQNKIIFLTIGRLVRRKGVDLVLSALADMKNKELAYIIIGRGPEEEKIKSLIAELGLKSQVKLLTNIEDDEKDHWLQLADVFVMTSRDEAGDYEGFGIVYLEAGLVGKPVIAARGGGVEDAVIDNETGILVTAGDIDELAGTMVKLAQYEGLRRRLGDGGRKRAQDEFNWEGQAEKIIKIISKS